VVLALVPLVIAVPTGAAGPAAKAALAPQQQAVCVLHNPQPAAPLEMNTVTANGLFKTVAMEKELFDCKNAAGGAVVIAKDLETFIEIIQNAKTVVDFRVELAHCTKNFPVGTVRCTWSKPDLIQITTPIKNCDPATNTSPPDPVVMNTAVAGVIKTIKVEKEIMRCGPEIGELYTFTQIVEARATSAAGPTFKTIQRQFFGLMCFKQEQQATINRCARFQP